MKGKLITYLIGNNNREANGIVKYEYLLNGSTYLAVEVKGSEYLKHVKFVDVAKIETLYYKHQDTGPR